MNYSNKQQKLIGTIFGLHNKINDIKKNQVYIKAFEKDMNECLKNLFPNVANQLNDMNEPNEWIVQLLECKNENEILSVLNRISVCEEKSIKEYNEPNYNTEIPNYFGDEGKNLHRQINALKTRFDDILMYMKDLEKEIVKLEKKLIEFSVDKNISDYEP